MSRIIVSEKNRSDIPSNILIEREILREKLELMKNISPPLLKRYINYLYRNESARSVNVNTAVKYINEIIKFLKYTTDEMIIDKSDIKAINKYDLNDIHVDDIQDYLDSCSSNTTINSKGQKILHNNSLKTISFKRTCINGFFTWLFKNGYIKRNETEKLRKIVNSEPPPVIILSDEEVKSMLELAENGVTYIYNNKVELSKKEMESHRLTKYRDLAILCLFIYHGLRIKELYHLNISSLNFDKNYFDIYRKRNKKRKMYFSKQSKKAIMEYIELERRNISISLEDKDALFISSNNFTRLSLRQIRRIVKKYAIKVSNNPKISPHKLRATFATKALKITGNLYAVQKSLDHSNPITTQRYLLEDEETKKMIAASIDYT